MTITSIASAVGAVAALIAVAISLDSATIRQREIKRLNRSLTERTEERDHLATRLVRVREAGQPSAGLLLDAATDRQEQP